jgi:hypothetical protein
MVVRRPPIGIDERQSHGKREHSESQGTITPLRVVNAKV